MVTTPRLTYQDYAALEGDERYELLDGRLVPVPSRNTAHQTVSIRLMTEMYFFVEENVWADSIQPRSTSCSQTSMSYSPICSSSAATGNTSSHPTTCRAHRT